MAFTADDHKRARGKLFGISRLASCCPDNMYMMIGDTLMGSKLKVQVLLPPVVDSDVISREFTVAVDGDEAPITTKLSPTAPSQAFAVPPNTKITVTLVDVDAAGNRSLPKTQSFTPVDTIPPHQPGDLQFQVLGQVEDEESSEPKTVAQQ